MGQFENTISQDDTFLPLPPSTAQNFKFFSNHFDLEEEDDALDFYTILENRRQVIILMIAN